MKVCSKVSTPGQFHIRTGKVTPVQRLCNFLKKLQVSCITVIRFHALVTAFAVKYVRRRSLPGKSSVNQNATREFFLRAGLREGAAE